MRNVVEVSMRIILKLPCVVVATVVVEAVVVAVASVVVSTATSIEEKKFK